MSTLKPIVLGCLAVIVACSGLLAVACSNGGATYKPSGLPELIAFTSDRDKPGHIYTINPDGTAIETTSSDNFTTDLLPAWSPDGTKIAFSSNQSGKYEIWTMNSDGSGRRRLTDRKSFSSMPKWSPDGEKIVFTSRTVGQQGISNTDIFTMNADASSLLQITDGAGLAAQAGLAGQSSTGEEKSYWNSVPAWSPDGSKILFGSNRSGDGIVPILYAMNPDGSGQSKFGWFADIDGTEPEWSPVTNKIVCVRGSVAKGDIWVMDGGAPFPLLTAKKLTNNIDNNHSPAWSRDGRQIAFVSDTNGNQDIFIMNADGSNLHSLTNGKSNNIGPAWR